MSLSLLPTDITTIYLSQVSKVHSWCTVMKRQRHSNHHTVSLPPLCAEDIYLLPSFSLQRPTRRHLSSKVSEHTVIPLSADRNIFSRIEISVHYRAQDVLLPNDTDLQSSRFNLVLWSSLLISSIIKTILCVPFPFEKYVLLSLCL